MDSAPLVSEDFALGASVIDALGSAAVPVDLAGWIYDHEQQEWRFVVATQLVDEVGTLQTYMRITAATADLGLPTAFLTRISVVSPEHPVVAHLRVVKEASEKGAEFPVLSGIDLPTTERSFLYNETGIAYEKAALGALQRVTPSRAVIRRAERVFYADPGFDFLVDDGDRRFLVQMKASARPVTRSQLRFFVTGFRARPAVLVISSTPLTQDAEEWVQQQRGLSFVTWRSPDDDDRLRASVESLLKLPPTMEAAGGP